MAKSRTRSVFGVAALAMLAMLAIPAAAAGQTVSGTSGEWAFAGDDSTAEASVTNPDGIVFGIVCTADCLNFLVADRPCPEGTTYTGTMRSAIGEFPVEMTCRQVEGQFVLTFSPGEEFIRITAECDELGFSVPLEDGNPSNFLFSLSGAYRAIYLTLANAMMISEPAQAEAETSR